MEPTPPTSQGIAEQTKPQEKGEVNSAAIELINKIKSLDLKRAKITNTGGEEVGLVFNYQRLNDPPETDREFFFFNDGTILCACAQGINRKEYAEKIKSPIINGSNQGEVTTEDIDRLIIDNRLYDNKRPTEAETLAGIMREVFETDVRNKMFKETRDKSVRGILELYNKITGVSQQEQTVINPTSTQTSPNQ